MRELFRTSVQVLLAGMLALALAPRLAARKHPTDLTEILADMNEAAKHLKTVSANLEYTKVTVLVDDKATETGQLFFRKGKTAPEIRIVMDKPENKVLLFRKNKGEIYYPKINQIQEYDLGQKSDMVQQFLLLGFGTDTAELKKSYTLKYLQEAELDGESTVLLELVPRRQNVAAQISKIQIWVSEDSWLPAQQKFFEAGGDYLIARYSAVKANRDLPNSKFELDAPANAKVVKMN
jgi:outer membrane lipoprotein-sorting protein